MAIKKIQDYKDNKFRSFPSEGNGKYKVKKKDYFLDYCQSFLHLYTSGNSNSLVKYKSAHLTKLDAYFKGEQGNKLVKDKLLRYDEKKGKHFGKIGNVFQTYDVLPEMLDVIFSINAKQSYGISSIAIDDMSTEVREAQKGMIKFLLDHRTKHLMDKLEYKGLDSGLSEAEMQVYSEADVDALFDSGGVQLDWEMAAKAACNSVSLASYGKEIENQCTEELIKWGFTAVRAYVDKATNTPKHRNVDMKHLIVQDSKRKNFSDITRFAEIRWVSLVELREIAPSITRQQYEDIIEGALGYSQNELYNSYFNDEYKDGYFDGSNNLFDDIKVPILDAQWLANDVEYDLFFKRNDVEVSKPVTPETKLSRKEVKNKNRIEKKKFIKRYDATWIIGSDILLEYGVAKHNSYYGPKGNKVPMLDISIIKTGKKSIVERCINFVEDINMLTVKLRNAIATLPPGPQLVIYQHALRNVSLNDKKQNAGDLIRGLIEEGILVANGQDAKGNYISANGGKAVDNLNLNVIEQVVTFSNEIKENINRIRQVIGLPEGLDGTAGNPYQGVGKQQLAAMGSSNATFPILSPIGPLFERAYTISVAQYQALATDKDIDIKDLSLSERASTVFKLSKNFSQSEFNIKLVYSPTEQEREFLIATIKELEGNFKATNGMIGIRTSEFLILYRLINADRIEEAIRCIARFERIRQAEANIQSQKMQENNAAVQQQSTQVAEGEKRQTIGMKGMEDRKKVVLDKGLDALNDARQSSYASSGEGAAPSSEPIKQEAVSQVAPLVEELMVDLEEQRAMKEAEQAQMAAEQQQMA